LKGFLKTNNLVADVDNSATKKCFDTLNNDQSILSDKFNP